MRFIDANIFLYAYLTPRRSLKEEEQRLKQAAKEIIQRLDEGESMATTTVHLSEVVNVIEKSMGLSHSISFIKRVLTVDSIDVYPVKMDDYQEAVPIAEGLVVGLNDALAYRMMKHHGITQVYSMDRHFDKFSGIERLP